MWGNIVIEGTLKYLGKRDSYIVYIFGHIYIFAISLESFIHKPDKDKIDMSFFEGKRFVVMLLETKYYFELDAPMWLDNSWDVNEHNPGSVYTFTQVHEHIVAGQADNAGYMSPTRFDGHKIKIHTFSIKEHTHYGRYPEIYPGEYEVGG